MHKAKFVVLSGLVGYDMWDEIEEILADKMSEEKQVEIETELIRRIGQGLTYKATEDVVSVEYLLISDPDVYDIPSDIGYCIAEAFIGTEFSISYTIYNPFFNDEDEFIFRDGGCHFDGKTLTNTVYDEPMYMDGRTIVWEVKEGDLVKVSSDFDDEEW